MSPFRPGVFTNKNPSNTILVTYSTSCFWVFGFTNHAGLRGNWSNLTIPKMPKPRVQPNAAPPRKCQVHVCTQVSCFQNAARATQDAALHKMNQSYTRCIVTQYPAKATQFSGSRHFRICLPGPLSSCVFLPTTARLALVVRSYVLSDSVCGVLLLL